MLLWGLDLIMREGCSMEWAVPVGFIAGSQRTSCQYSCMWASVDAACWRHTTFSTAPLEKQGETNGLS